MELEINDDEAARLECGESKWWLPCLIAALLRDRRKMLDRILELEGENGMLATYAENLMKNLRQSVDDDGQPIPNMREVE